MEFKMEKSGELEKTLIEFKSLLQISFKHSSQRWKENLAYLTL